MKSSVEEDENDINADLDNSDNESNTNEEKHNSNNKIHHETIEHKNITNDYQHLQYELPNTTINTSGTNENYINPNPNPNNNNNDYTTVSIQTNNNFNQNSNSTNNNNNIPNIEVRRSERLKFPTRSFMHEAYQISNIQNNQNNPYNNIKSSEIPTPNNFKEAMNSIYKAQWKRAADDEINSLIKRKVFKIVQKPNNIIPLRSQWIFKAKSDKDGYISKFKARLVANGNEQSFSEKYKITSPVLGSTTLLLLITIAVKLNWKIYIIDVKTAYLYAKLDKEIYMYLPSGYYYHERQENKVALLQRSLYGLKESAKLWNLELTKTLSSLGFKQLKLDPCVYSKPNFIIGIYVDDILLISKFKEDIDLFKFKFKQIYDITDNNEVTSILGRKLTKFNNNTIIIQDTYIQELLNKFNFNYLKTKDTPMESRLTIDKNTEILNFTIQKDFQKKVGSLLYLMIHSRPDIAYSINKMSQFNSNPNIQHLNYIKRIFSYLKKTINLGIKIDLSNNFQLKAYVDASFADDANIRKSTTGFVIFIDNTPIFWRSKKQNLVAKSTMEAEMIALETATSEIIWIRNLLNELNFNQHCTNIYCDNTSAIEFATNQNLNSRNKYIDIRKCFIKEYIKNNIIKLNYIESNLNIADIFTKTLHKSKFQYFIEQLNIVDIKKECWQNN